MKRLVILTIMVQLSVLAFAQNISASIREITGTVELKIPTESDWIPAKQGDQLERETIVSTGFRSSAIIEAGSSVILVHPLTRLSLEAIMSTDAVEMVNLDLKTGRIRVDVKAPAGSRADFSVQTPSSVASVRGTSFDIDTVNITVREGAVRYEPATGAAGNPVLVTANQSSWVDTDTGKPVNSLDASEINRSLPRLPGQDAMPAAVSGGTVNAFGNLDVGVNLASYQGLIDIGTSLTGNQGLINIGTNLSGNQGSLIIDVDLVNK